MAERPNFIPMQKWLLAGMCNGALSFYLFGHRAVACFQDHGFYPESMVEHRIVFWLACASAYTALLGGLPLLIGLMERWLARGFSTRGGPLETLGHVAVRNAVLLTTIPFVGGCLLTWLDPGLLNPWDILFLAVFSGIFYVGSYFHFYYGVPLELWRTDDRNIELEKLKIEYDEQRMWLRTFLWITVSFLISQVFVALKLKFEPYFKNPELHQNMESIMVVNALQIMFLLAAMWALVFSLVIRRMEEVKLQLRSLGLATPATTDKQDNRR